MPIEINGSGNITGISAGGLPDASVTPADLTQPLTLGTSQAATGTSVDFTGIPSWVKRVTVIMNGVSTNGSSLVQIQIGPGSFVTTGYSCTTGLMVNASTTQTVTTSTSGFIIPGVSNNNGRSGHNVITALGGNAWVFSTVGGYNDVVASWSGGGAITLSGTLDRIRITTVNGTDTFDAGSINILYE